MTLMDTLITQKKDRRSDFDSLGVKTRYYRYIQDIWELDYGVRLQISAFKCQWVKHLNGVSVDNYGVILVDLKNVGHKDDPWMVADRAAQVFYILDSETVKHILVSVKQKIVEVENLWKIMTRISISLKRCDYSPIQRTSNT
jgi:hypothetical protein